MLSEEQKAKLNESRTRSENGLKTPGLNALGRLVTKSARAVDRIGFAMRDMDSGNLRLTSNVIGLYIQSASSDLQRKILA